MSSSKTLRGSAHEDATAGMLTRPHLRARARAAAVAVLLWGTACGPDFHLAASNLDISPNPASPGDIVVARFLVSLVPSQNHTIVVFIDDIEHVRVTGDGAPDIPAVVELGDAAALIAEYGTGEHTAYVEVHANEENEKARTRTVSFALEAAT